MANYLFIVLVAAIAIAAAKPLPDYDDDGQEVLSGTDTRYYGLPLFWYQRPLTGEDGFEYGGYGGTYARPVHRHRDHLKTLYETVGAGWGR